MSYGEIFKILRARKQTKQKCWRRPIFPGRFQPSIFGAGELNFCVRNGNRWTLTVKITNYSACACQRTVCSFGVGIDLFFRAASSQVSSAQMSLTSVFGMGTGGPSSLKIPTIEWTFKCSLKTEQRKVKDEMKLKCMNLKSGSSSPRPISITQLHTLLHFHLWPINLVVFKGSY